VSERDQIADLASRLHQPDLDFAPTRPFFAAAERGELAIPRCQDCAAWVWYPQAICPACGGRRIDWTKVSGRGRIFTWVRVHRSFLPGLASRVPYVTALIELEEDPALRIPTILLCGHDVEPAVGAPVEVTFERVSESPPITVPRFRLRSAVADGPGAPRR
jgi:uncharacterized OB-fold protein